MVAKFLGKFKQAPKQQQSTSKNGTSPSKPSVSPKSESLAHSSGTPRSTRATPEPVGSKSGATLKGKPKSPKMSLSTITSIILGVIILLMVIAAILYFVFKPSEGDSEKIMVPNVTQKPEIPVCETPQCVSLAHQLLNWRDDKVNPCDDFYQYTCGKYAEHVNSEHSTVSWKNQLMHGTITEHINRMKNPQTKSEKAMKRVFENCQNVSQSQSQHWSNESLDDLFSKIQQIGKFPMLDSSFNTTEFDASSYLGNMAKVFKTFHFGFFEFMPTQKCYILADQQGISMSASKSIILSLLNRNGLTLPSNIIDNYLTQVKNFIKDKLKSSERDGEALNVGNFNELNQKSPIVKLDAILRKLMTPKQVDYFDDKIVLDLSLVDANPNSQMENLDTLITTSDQTMLANFLLVVILNNADRLMVTSSSRCSKQVMNLMPHLSIGIMIRHYFNKQNLEKVSGIIDEMRVAYKKMLWESTWLQNSTRTNAVKKLEKMRKVVGFSEEFQDPEKFERIFENEFQWNDGDSHYELCLKLVTFARHMILDELVDGRLFPITEKVTVTNAFYAPYLNMMILTVPMLDDPLFDASYPKYAQIGAIGYIVGHEIGHAFDPNGAKYDENGNYRNWWTTEDQAEFNRRTQCVINKYENYDDPKFGRNRLNGTLTIGENVADILGTRVSYDIYKNVDVAKEPKLVGLQDHNIDKLFFQILATKTCAPYNTRTLKNQLKDVHGVNNYRVNGVFSNMKQFAETFNCPVGSKMNPATKCELF